MFSFEEVDAKCNAEQERLNEIYNDSTTVHRLTVSTVKQIIIIITTVFILIKYVRKNKIKTENERMTKQESELRSSIYQLDKKIGEVLSIIIFFSQISTYLE